MVQVYLLSVQKRFLTEIARGAKRVEYRGKRLCPSAGNVLVIGFKEDGVWKPVLVARVDECRRVAVDGIDAGDSVKRMLKHMYGDHVNAIRFTPAFYLVRQEREELYRLLGFNWFKMGHKRLTPAQSRRVLEYLRGIAEI